MKLHILFLLISFLCLANLNAQEMNIYLNDNTKASFPLSKNPVSSITDGTLQVKVGNFVKEFPLKDVKECKVEYNDANPELAKYDYNYDRVIDVQDINALVDYLLTQEPSEEFSIQKLTELINHIITSKDNEEDASNILFDVSESTDLGPAYYWGYKMMQGCTTFRDKLYLFFASGYYQIRDLNSYELLEEKMINIPKKLHYGSVQFCPNIEEGHNMPYLYATDDINETSRVFLIDIENDVIVKEYNSIYGHIAAFDFANDTGFLISNRENFEFWITPFSLSSGIFEETIKLPTETEMEGLQSAVYKDGHVYVLTGLSRVNTQIIDYNINRKKIEHIHNFAIQGEPEGIFIKENGDIVVTSVVGTNWYANWNDKTTDPIRAAYYIIKPINNK